MVKFEFRGVEYDVNDPKFSELLEADREMFDEFKRSLINDFERLDIEKQKELAMDILHTMFEWCSMLVDIIRVEKGIYETHKSQGMDKGW